MVSRRGLVPSHNQYKEKKKATPFIKSTFLLAQREKEKFNLIHSLTALPSAAWGPACVSCSLHQLISLIIPSIDCRHFRCATFDCLLPPLNSICFFLPFSSFAPPKKGKKKQIKFKFRKAAALLINSRIAQSPLPGQQREE